MTTNITSIEAIKELKRIFHEIKCSPINETVYRKVKQGLDLATQALAPQENGTLGNNNFTIPTSEYKPYAEFKTCDRIPQECDVTKCKFYKQSTGECLCKNLKYKEQPKTNFCDAIQNNSCYYKQLHSQEKTFTVEEIKDIVEKIFDKHLELIEPPFVLGWNGDYRECLLAEFEKAVGE